MSQENAQDIQEVSDGESDQIIPSRHVRINGNPPSEADSDVQMLPPEIIEANFDAPISSNNDLALVIMGSQRELRANRATNYLSGNHHVEDHQRHELHHHRRVTHHQQYGGHRHPQQPSEQLMWSYGQRICVLEEEVKVLREATSTRIVECISTEMRKFGELLVGCFNNVATRRSWSGTGTQAPPSDLQADHEERLNRSDQPSTSLSAAIAELRDSGILRGRGPEVAETTPGRSTEVTEATPGRGTEVIEAPHGRGTEVTETTPGRGTVVTETTPGSDNVTVPSPQAEPVEAVLELGGEASTSASSVAAIPVGPSQESGAAITTEDESTNDTMPESSQNSRSITRNIANDCVAGPSRAATAPSRESSRKLATKQFSEDKKLASVMVRLTRDPKIDEKGLQFYPARKVSGSGRKNANKSKKKETFVRRYSTRAHPLTDDEMESTSNSSNAHARGNKLRQKRRKI